MISKVVFTGTIFPDFEVEKEVLKQISSNLVVCENELEETIISDAKDCDALVTVYSQITENIINSMEKCKIIVRCGIGFNNIDIPAATNKGIFVVNVPDYCWDEVSDHTIALALALARKINIFDKKVKKGEWNHSGAVPILGLRGQTFGLVGFGNIPKMVAEKVKAFGFNIIAYDPYVSQAVADNHGVRLVSLEELYKESDFISLHAPLNDESYHMINKDTLALMKSTAFVINTARGGLINVDDLYVALKEGVIGGAGIDVLEQEPPSKDLPIYGLDNVIFTPHAAFYSEASSLRLREYAFKEVVRVLSGNNPKNLLNKEVLNK